MSGPSLIFAVGSICITIALGFASRPGGRLHPSPSAECCNKNGEFQCPNRKSAEHYESVNEKHMARYGWEMRPFYDNAPFSGKGYVYSGEYNWNDNMRDELSNYCADVDPQTGYCERCERRSFQMNASPEERAYYWANVDGAERSDRRRNEALKKEADDIKTAIWASQLLFH